jgi:hypothetical protein
MDGGVDAPSDAGPDALSDSQPSRPEAFIWQDSRPCESPDPPRSNYVDTCRLAHRPSDASHLSNKTPAGTEPVTVRLETQAGDVQKVTLRVWTGLARELPMTLEATHGGLDIYRAAIPPSARPVYYRFKIEEGSAVVYLTRGGPQTTPPTSADDFFVAPVASDKTIHYATDFTQPEIWIRAGGTYSKKPMVSEGTTRAGVTGAGTAGQEMFFYLKDAKTGSEDHPPGGGDYRMPSDWDEAWLDQGTLFDVDPDTVTLDRLDCHTHPFNRVGSSIVYDPAPLVSLLPANGIGAALTMVGGTFAAQKAALGDLHRKNRWIVPLVWVSPADDTVAGAEDLLKNAGFRGLKFHPVIDSYPADGPLMDPFLDLAAKYRVPVQIHSATDDVAQPARIVALAKRHPDVPIVMIHTELGAIDKTATLNLIKPVPNIYAETSWTNPESILQAMSLLDSSRTLFGTDSTIDGYQMFTNQSIANPQGAYVYTVTQVMAMVQAQANPGAYANWARLTGIRLYGWRFRPDPDLYDTDGDGIPDVSDPDDDNDGKPDGSDPGPLNPSK